MKRFKNDGRGMYVANNTEWVKSVVDAQKRLGDPNVQWLDVREQEEVQQIRIPGITWIPMGSVLQRIDELDANKETFVVCLSGARSAEVTHRLRALGFDRAYNVAGGMIAWVEAGLPVERG